MDVAGAKALKKRLGQNGTDEAQPSAAHVSDDAPPIYQWTGVSHPAPETSPGLTDDETAEESVSLFRRLGLSFR